MKRIINDEFLSMLAGADLVIDRPMRGLFGGDRRSKVYGSSMDFADYRDYAPGDDLRAIDWNLYARFEKLYLKLFYDERQLHHRIYIDASSSMDWGKPGKDETALQIAAALAYLAVRGNDKVGISLLREDRCVPLCPAFVGIDGFYRAADLLNRAKFYGQTDWARALEGETDPGHDDGLSVIVSDFLTDGDFRRAVDRLVYLGRQVHLIQVLSEDEITPDLRGKLFLYDVEALGEEDDRNLRLFSSRARVKAYEKALQWHQKQLRDFCASRGAGFFTVCSDEPIFEILFRKATEERLIQ